MSILSELSKQLGMDEKRVCAILLELPEISASAQEQHEVLEAAGKKGLDLGKLRIARRIHTRKEAIEEILGYVESHPTWRRAEIISYMRYSMSLMRRVEKKILPDFFK